MLAKCRIVVVKNGIGVAKREKSLFETPYRGFLIFTVYVTQGEIHSNYFLRNHF